MRALFLVLAILLAGCDFLPKSNEEEGQNPSDGWGKARVVDEAEERIGRFQFYPASGEMPAVLLDTATGCIEMLERFTLDDKPKGSVWIRKISDEVMEGTPKRCNVKRFRYNPTTEKIESIDGSKPTASNR